MKKIIIYIFFLLVSSQIFSFESLDFVKNAVEQIDYLYARNKKIEKEALSDKKWYLYFVDRDKTALESYLIGNSNIKSFSSGYLDHLNDLLIKINSTEKVAMYIAISDYNTPITVPIIPYGKSIEDKIQNLKSLLDPDNPASIFDKEKLDPDQVRAGIKGYEQYKAFFYEKAEEIFQSSVLSKVSDGKRVMMPFSVYHYVNEHNQKKKYYTFLTRASNPTKDADADETAKDFRSFYNDNNTLKGKSVDEKKLEKVVMSYLDYYSGNTGVTITSKSIKTQIPKDSELYTRAFGENGFEPDTSFDLTKHMLDFSGMLSQKEKDDILREIDFKRDLLSGMKMYVVLTDQNTSPDILQEMENLKPTNTQYVIWLHLDEEGYLNLSNITAPGIAERIAYATSHWTEKMWANAELNLGKGTVAHLKANLALSNQLLTYASDILAMGMVPEKYWNPKHNDYPSYMPYVASAFNATMGDFGSVLNTEQAQMQFAFKTGVWNGVIDEVKGLADAGKMATEYFLNPEKAEQFDQGLSQLTFGAIWDSFKKAHGFEEGQETNEFKLSHQLGKDVVFVASFFIGVGEIAALAKTGKMAKVGTLANNMSKLSKVIAGGVIKILKKMPQNVAKTIKKLPDNIIREVKKVGAKSYLILKLNTTKLAKISDEGVFTKMNLIQEGAVIKLVDGSSGSLDNVKFIDEFGEASGKVDIVKNGDEIGFRNKEVVKKIETKLDVDPGVKPNEFSINHKTELDRYGDKVELGSATIVDDVAKEVEFTVTVVEETAGKFTRYAFGKDVHTKLYNFLKNKMGSIRSMKTSWVGVDGLDANLKKLNQLTQDVGAGDVQKIREAILETKAGQWKKELGYNKVEIIEKVGEPGNYKSIKIRFIDESVSIAAKSIDELLATLKNIVPTNKWDKFVKDFGNDVSKLSKFTDDLGLVNSWRILDDANRTTLKLNFDVLTKLNKVLKNTKLDDFLPIKTAKRNITNKTELLEQVVKLQDEAASIVGKRMSGMEDLMDELDHFLVNFSNKPGAIDFIKELTESGGKMAGGSLVLRTLRNNADELGSVVKFESQITNQFDEIGDIVVDVVTDKGILKNVLNEFKNWRAIPSNRYTSFTKQFTGYLTNKNLGEFFYFFRKGVDGKGLKNLEELKNQVITAFKNKKELFENLPDEKFESIFGFSKDLKALDDIDIQNFIDSRFNQIFKLIE
ncbi:hypothetical protein [Aquimarina algiphila]|uniref:hypothetical protein n=1 Tax=Aquimarina algiphila TaxID=2047982 RepID=UPI00232AD2D9|nr:hypothetical protein [Aquimarina algiphila]